MEIREVEITLKDAWVGNMASGVTRARKEYWRAWSLGFVSALFITGHLSVTEERKLLDYIAEKSQ